MSNCVICGEEISPCDNTCSIECEQKYEERIKRKIRSMQDESSE